MIYYFSKGVLGFNLNEDFSCPDEYVLLFDL